MDEQGFFTLLHSVNGIFKYRHTDDTGWADEQRLFTLLRSVNGIFEILEHGYFEIQAHG